MLTGSPQQDPGTRLNGVLSLERLWSNYEKDRAHLQLQHSGTGRRYEIESDDGFIVGHFPGRHYNYRSGYGSKSLLNPARFGNWMNS